MFDQFVGCHSGAVRVYRPILVEHAWDMNPDLADRPYLQLPNLQFYRYVVHLVEHGYSLPGTVIHFHGHFRVRRNLRIMFHS